MHLGLEAACVASVRYGHAWHRSLLALERERAMLIAVITYDCLSFVRGGTAAIAFHSITFASSYYGYPLP